MLEALASSDLQSFVVRGQRCVVLLDRLRERGVGDQRIDTVYALAAREDGLGPRPSFTYNSASLPLRLQIPSDPSAGHRVDLSVRRPPERTVDVVDVALESLHGRHDISALPFDRGHAHSSREVN